MEFIAANRYTKEKLSKAVDYDEIKNLEKVKINQKLELITDKDNAALLDKYVRMGLKVIPVRRFSEKDWSGRKDFPGRVMLETTSRCNFNCRMCPRHNLKRPLVDLEKEVCFKVLDELDRYGVGGVWFYYLGEPILHKDWREIMDYSATKKNLGTIWFSTNGFAFNEEVMDYVLDSNIDYLNYSLHGTNEDVYGFVSPKQHYKTVRRNLERFLEKKQKLVRGPIVHIQMIDQEGTHGNINEFLETFHQTGEMVSINMLDYGYLPNNEYGLKQRVRPPMVSKCNRISRGDCVIASNGDIQPCDNDYNSEILPGCNVKNQTIYECWNSEARRRVEELNNKGEMYKIEHCRSCTDYDL